MINKCQAKSEEISNRKTTEPSLLSAPVLSASPDQLDPTPMVSNRPNPNFVGIAESHMSSEHQHPEPQNLSNSAVLRQIFGSVSAKSCPAKLNFHLHTVFSDGRMQPEDIVNQAIAAQISHFSITDHHTVEGYLIAKRMLQRLVLQNSEESGDFPEIWVGVEINASLMFNEVHILGYGFDPDHAAIRPYLQGHTTAGLEYQCTSVIKSIHQAGGLAILAHPARYRRGAEELVPAAVALGIDGVETYYGYDHCDPWYPSPKQLAIVKHLGDSYGLVHTCGTDSHGLKISRRL
jgi:predicted metal-dependent phosphoesterase TrpH